MEPATSFFTVLVCDFSKKLKMPRAFVDHYHGATLCKLQGPTGNSWDVKLKEENNFIFFGKGWNKFAKDNFLDEGDFLVFNYDGDSCFAVTIYDENCCEMDMEEARTTRDAGGDLVAPVEFITEHFCFKKTLTKNILYQLSIPRAIVTGLELQIRNQKLKLMDPENRSWPLRLKPMDYGRLRINTGLAECWKENQIEKGNTVVFEFAEKHVKLHIFRAKGCEVILTGPNVVT